MTSNPIQEAQAEFVRTMQQQTFDESNLDYSVLDHHAAFIRQLELIDGNYHEIFDMMTMRKAVVSSRLLAFLGFATQEEADAAIVPDDAYRIVKIGTHFLRYGYTVDTPKRKHLKMTSDYRIRNAEGETVRLTEHHIPLELDARGNFWLILSSISLSPERDVSVPMRHRFTDVETGMMLLLSPKNDTLIQSPISDREAEVLELIAQGKSSKQIAGMLFISTNTVNTHRQRIIEKLGVSNTAQAVDKFRKYVATA